MKLLRALAIAGVLGSVFAGVAVLAQKAPWVTQTGPAAFVSLPLSVANGGTGIAIPLASTNLSDVAFNTAWTPTDASGAGLVFTSVSAFYSRIGAMYFVYASFVYPATGSGSNANIGGFPVTGDGYFTCPLISAASAAVKGQTLNGAATMAILSTAATPTTNAQLSGSGVTFQCQIQHH